ncbi:MAG: NAD-dependent epimerase/dehydratase family protein [Saprospiraceae bacterium]|nr:NAD-dependent epimerase/dehydratase family protein [Saprospiraceae bacterium]
MQKTIAVTGASGHLGNVVCRQLCGQGHRVRAMYHSFKQSLEGLSVELVQGNILDEKALERLLTGCEVVVHCAAIISIHGDPTGEVFRTNTEGPRLLLEVASRVGVRRIVHISSVHAAVEVHGEPFDETRPYKGPGDYAYDHSKAVGEQVLLLPQYANKPEVVVLRPSCIVGPFDFKPSEIGKALLQFFNQKIPALPPGGYDFVDVRDVAETILQAIERGRNGEVYLTTGKYFSMKALSALIGRATGKRTPQMVMPYSLLKALLPLLGLYAKLSRTPPLFTVESIDALKNGHTKMDNSKAAAELGHRCRPLEESVQDFYQWKGLSIGPKGVNS